MVKGPNLNINCANSRKLKKVNLIYVLFNIKLKLLANMQFIGAKTNLHTTPVLIIIILDLLVQD